MLVRVERIEGGYKALLFKDKKIVGEMLGLDLFNLHDSLKKVWGVVLFNILNSN